MLQAALSFLGHLLPSLLGAGPADDPVSRSWFVNWARETQIRSLESDFTTELKRTTGPSDVFRGQWKVKFDPYYSQFLSFKRYQDGVLSFEAQLSWDSERGEGRTFRRDGRQVRGSGTLLQIPPKEFGDAELPSDSFFLFSGDRSLFRQLEDSAFTVSRSEHRLEVYLFKPGATGLLVYLFDPESDKPLMELRFYTKNSALAVRQKNAQIGEPIDLPADFQDAVCLARKVVTGWAKIKGRQFPVAWRLRHTLAEPDLEVNVRLIPDTIVLNENSPQTPFTVSWPPNIAVFDAARGTGSLIPGFGEGIAPEVISESDLDHILEVGGFAGAATNAPRKEATTVTGCGANVLYLVCAMLNRPNALESLVADLGIRQGRPECSMEQLAQAASRGGVEAVAAKATSRSIRTPAGTPVILHAIWNPGPAVDSPQGIGHFLLVDDYDSKTDTFRVFDPPAVPYRAPAMSVLRSWTGRALLFGSAAKQIQGGFADWAIVLRYALVALCILSASISVCLVWRRKWRGA